MPLTRLPGSKIWVETNDVTFDVLNVYNKVAINADIDAIRITLQKYPDATQESKDVVSISNLISASDWTTNKKDRISALVGSMYQSYLGDSKNLEAAQLQSRLDALITLRDRLV